MCSSKPIGNPLRTEFFIEFRLACTNKLIKCLGRKKAIFWSFFTDYFRIFFRCAFVWPVINTKFTQHVQFETRHPKKSKLKAYVVFQLSNAHEKVNIFVFVLCKTKLFFHILTCKIWFHADVWLLHPKMKEKYWKWNKL